MSETNTGIRARTPFKELDFYEEEDALKFAGRERDARQLVSRIVTSRAVVLHGRSGLGKTSLLRAGVLPQLRQQNFRPVYIRTLDSLLGDLTDAVISDFQMSEPLDGSGDPEERARRVLETAAKNRPVVLVLDQFEEFFTRFERKVRDRQAFVRFIVDLIRDEKCDVRVLFSLREDYLCALDEFQRKLPDLFTQAFRLLPLTPLGARDAIVRPLVNEGVPYDEALITRLVDELTGFDFDSARLQVTCSEVYRQALAASGGNIALHASDLDALEESTTGLSGIYKRYLRAAVANVEPGLHLDAKLLLDKLITAKRTKFAIERDALREEFGDIQRLNLVLTALEKQKLVRSERRGEKEWFELRHECLAEEILEWFKEDDAFAGFRFVRGLIEENSLGGRFKAHPEMLLTEGQLAALASLHERLRLTPEQREYVIHSAVYTRSSEVLGWAKFQSSPGMDSILRTLAVSPFPQMRVGAIQAIGIVRTQAPDLLALCLQIASDKKAPKELQTAAQRSAARNLTEADLATLKKLVRFGRTPQYVREILADLYEAGRMRERFNLFQSWLTVRYIFLRRCREYADKRAGFFLRGLQGGVCGSAICALPTMIAVYLAHPAVSPGASPAERARWVAEISAPLFALFGAAVIIGVFVGLRNGAAAFRASVMGTPRWKIAAAPSLLSSTTITRIIAWILAASFLNVFLLGWPVLRWILSGLVGLTEPVVRKGSDPTKRIVRATALCLSPAIPLLVAFKYANDPVRVILGCLITVLYLLNIDLCSFSIAFPDKGIQGAQPLDRSKKHRTYS